jgi:hypothetical protein
MMSISESYANAVRRDTGLYFAAWSPESRYNLGDVGVLQHGRMFVQKTSLKDEGIDFDEAPDKDPGSVDISSTRDVSVSLKLSGEVNPSAPNLPKGEAGVVVSLGHESSYVIRSEKVYEPRISNMAQVERVVMERFKARKWEKEWVIISQLVQCARVDILIAKSSNTRVEIRAKGNIPVGTTVDLGDVNVGFEIVHTTGAVFNFLNTQNATPLFQLVGIRRRFPFGTSIGTRGRRMEVDAHSVSMMDDQTLRDHADLLFLGSV